MSHLILENDLTFSVSSPEWHGLAQVIKMEEMPQAVREHLCFPIVSAQLMPVINGVPVDLSGGMEISELGESFGTVDAWQLILADCSNLPKHEGREKHPAPFVPLHVPKSSYFPLENSRFFEIAEKAFSDLGLDFRVSTAGTLGNLRRFYFSVSLEGIEIKSPDGHKLESFLSFLTSHDGFLAPTVKDSHIRVVCANTFGAVMNAFSNFSLVGKHTENGLSSLDNLGKAIEAFQTGAGEIGTTFERLANVSLSLDETRETVAGYFFQDALRNGVKIPDSVTLTKQAENATDEITQLSRTGSGNTGGNLYDVLNGATDYWTNGSGAGSHRVGLAKRVSRSQFGQAATHKAEFVRYVSDPDALATGQRIGKLALANLS